MDVGEEIHHSQKTLMKSSAHHSGQRVGLVAVCDMGIGSDMDRVGKDWGRTGEWYFRKNGGGDYRLTLGSGSQSQTVGLGMGLLPNIHLRRCWESSAPTHKNTNIFPSWNPPLSLLNLASTPLSLPGISPGPLSISSSLLLKAFIAKSRCLALPIEDLPVTISFQSSIFLIQFTIFL